GLSQEGPGALGEMREGGPLLHAHAREFRRAGSAAELSRADSIGRSDEPLDALPLRACNTVRRPEGRGRTAHGLDACGRLRLAELREPDHQRISRLGERARRRRGEFGEHVVHGLASLGLPLPMLPAFYSVDGVGPCANTYLVADPFPTD